MKLSNDRLHGSFYSNTVWQYGLQIIKYLFPLVTLPYLTRVLEPEGYAVYAYVVSFMTFVQTFVDFGFNLSGTKKIAKSSSIEEENQVIGAVMQARLLLCVLAGCGVFSIALALPITRENMLYTALAYVAVCGKALAPDFLFQGHERMSPLTTRFFISKGVSTLLTFVFIQSIDDMLWIPILDIFSSFIALLWSFIAARQMFGTTIARVYAGLVFGELKESAVYCLSNMASAAFTGFTTLLIGVLVEDSVQVSYWSLAMTAVSAVQALYTPITNSLYPHMVRGNDFTFARKICLISLPVVLLGTIMFVLLSDLIVLILGGESYLDGSWVFRAVSPILVFSFYAMLLGWPVAGAAGKMRELTATTLGSSLFCIISLLLMAVLDMATVFACCVIRSATEAILCFSRFVLAMPLLKEGSANGSGIRK